MRNITLSLQSQLDCQGIIDVALDAKHARHMPVSIPNTARIIALLAQEQGPAEVIHGLVVPAEVIQRFSGIAADRRLPSLGVRLFGCRDDRQCFFIPLQLIRGRGVDKHEHVQRIDGQRIQFRFPRDFDRCRERIPSDAPGFGRLDCRIVAM